MIDGSHLPHLAFGVIAVEWAKEEGAPGTEDEILELLAQAMWRGDFEEDGNSILGRQPDFDDKWTRAMLRDALFGVDSTSKKWSETNTRSDAEWFGELAKKLLDFYDGAQFWDLHLKKLLVARKNFANWVTGNRLNHPKFWFPAGKDKAGSIGRPADKRDRIEKWIRENYPKGVPEDKATPDLLSEINANLGKEHADRHIVRRALEQIKKRPTM